MISSREIFTVNKGQMGLILRSLDGLVFWRPLKDKDGEIQKDKFEVKLVTLRKSAERLQVEMIFKDIIKK